MVNVSWVSHLDPLFLPGSGSWGPSWGSVPQAHHGECGVPGGQRVRWEGSVLAEGTRAYLGGKLPLHPPSTMDATEAGREMGHLASCWQLGALGEEGAVAVGQGL